ncbi:O-antigen ligase family protein [Vibrio splendidus]|uniref:O-antigen ligase family protein n=1 Tax=Vibrio splendidus TaxID=29497 RepID=UPI000C820641|nr:O-antigen ligase family protein [Vibrio splendidus]PMI31420.1 RfaL protein [Vibrio splendidus]PMM36097.1 RfaL protein [Vibrio splendidus]PMO73967.1 RfaL protein [Vibrio splendidus]PTP66459.1 RfaL protein [Vibrio splendidus]
MIIPTNIRYNASSLLSGVFFSCLLLTGSSYKLAATPLLLIALFSLPWTIRHKNSLEVKAAICALLSYFVVTALSLVVYGGDLGQLDMPTRVIFAAIIMLFISSYSPSIKVIFYSISLGASIAGGLAIYDFISSGGRAFIDNGYMVIQAGGIASSLALLSIVSLIYAKHTQDRTLVLVSTISIILGLSATLLAGARGAWVLLPLIIVCLFYNYRNYFSFRSKAIGMLSIVAIVAFSYPTIEPRISSMISDIHEYQNNDSRTSSGFRLEMWKSATYSAIDKPIFGQGFDGVKQAKKEQVEKGLVDKSVLNYKRAHNQFFEELQTKGLIGLFVMLAFFGVPLYLLWKKVQTSCSRDEQYFFAVAGVVHITSVIGFSLTQHYLAHHSGILYYTIGTAIFFGAAYSKRHKLEVKSS